MRKKTIKLYCDVCGKNCRAESFLVHQPEVTGDPFDSLAHGTFSIKAQCTRCSTFIATVAMTPSVMLTVLTTPIPLEGVEVITFNDPYETQRSTKA